MKQDALPDVVPGVIPEIEGAAKDYLTHRDTRLAIQEDENKAHDHLLTVMRRADVMTYRTVEGFDCERGTTEKVKVSKAKEAKGGG